MLREFVSELQRDLSIWIQELWNHYNIVCNVVFDPIKLVDIAEILCVRWKLYTCLRER